MSFLFVTVKALIFRHRITTACVSLQNPQFLPAKPLPADRTQSLMPLSHSQELEEVQPKENKLTVRELQSVLDDHENEPDDWPVERIAEEYNLKKEYAG